MENPCVKVYGPGPEGARCKTCALLVRNGRYAKCRLRRISHGAATDHRVYHPACGKYQAA